MTIYWTTAKTKASVQDIGPQNVKHQEKGRKTPDQRTHAETTALRKNPAGASGLTADWERSWKHEETKPSLNLSLKETDFYPFLSTGGKDRLPRRQELLCLKITTCEPHRSKTSCKTSTHETCKCWPTRSPRRGSYNKHGKGKVVSCTFSVSSRPRKESNLQ